jgi:CRP/FNR family transcriptional regulator, cyclic AMP receptor protein
MNLDWLRERLSQLHFSAELPAVAVDRVAEIGELRECHIGEVLFREGSERREFYLLVSGRLVLTMQVPGRGDVPILTLGPGDPVAWSALIGEGRMTTSAVATESARLICISAERLDNLCCEDHEFGYYWMRALAIALSQRLMATRRQLLDSTATMMPQARAT